MQTTDWSEATRNWRPPSEIAGQGPREVRLAPGGIALTALSLLMFVGAGVMYWFLSRQGAREAAERAALDAGSVETEATVTRHWRAGGKSDTPMITYEFQYQGHVYHGRSSAPGREWRNLGVGSAIPIRFVPGQPEVNHPSAWAVHVMPAWLPLLMAGIFALTGFLPRFLTRRQAMLLRDGRAAPARVTAHVRIKGGYATRYEFRLPDGTVRRGRGGKGYHPPEIGSIIPVLFDPEHPRRNAPYPLELVRVQQ